MVDDPSERRYASRRPVRFPVQFRLLSSVYDVQRIALSDSLEGQIRDLGTRGLGVVVECYRPDHLASQLACPDVRIFLQWELANVRIGAAALPVWSEVQASTRVVAGLRFVDVKHNDQVRIRDFVHETPRGRDAR